MIQRYQNEVVGFNNRMTEINAAIGLVQLTKIDAFNTKRIRNAQRLASGIDRIAGIRAPRMRPDSKHVFHQFTVLVEHDREEFQAELGKLGVQSAVYYPTPVHKLQSFQREDELPVTEELARTCLSLPIHPGLSSREIDEVANAIRKIMGVK
jgi:dTDP-4-amino-4,6-dideoxygalactose transaminase